MIKLEAEREQIVDKEWFEKLEGYLLPYERFVKAGEKDFTTLVLATPEWPVQATRKIIFRVGKAVR